MFLGPSLTLHYFEKERYLLEWREGIIKVYGPLSRKGPLSLLQVLSYQDEEDAEEKLTEYLITFHYHWKRMKKGKKRKCR